LAAANAGKAMKVIVAILKKLASASSPERNFIVFALLK
jgi:hypothetical protein